jgi:hypothetical protein
MKGILLLIGALAVTVSQAHASGGFSCEAEDKNVTKLVVEGSTPRSEPGLINFGGILEDGGRKVEFQKSDVKGFTGRNGVIQVRATARAGEDNVSIYLNVRRNPKDEDDWGGTYEVKVASAKDKKAKPAVKRGKVKCVVE